MHDHLQEFFTDLGGTPHSDETLGLVHPMARQFYDGKDWQDVGIVAVVFLNEEHLTYEIIAHEAFHAAMCFERYANGHERPTYGEGCDEDEERVAYLVGEITGAIHATLFDGHHVGGCR